MQGIANKKNGSHFGAKEAKWKIGAIIKNIDGFGQEIPSFNMKGETRVNTLYGGVIIVVILSLTLAYAILKGIHLLHRTNPTINTYSIPSHFDISRTVNLSNIGFRVAFSFRGSKSHLLLDDPHYVKWIVRRTGMRNGTSFEETLPYHKCTEADFAGFRLPAKRSQDALKEIREDPKKSLFCLDEWTENLSIGGDEETADWSTVEMTMAPCNYIRGFYDQTLPKDTVT